MLEVKNVVKKYKNFTLNVSMELKPGMITGLVGANGAGKSTTFKIMLGLVNPDGGEVLINGMSVKAYKNSGKEDIGCVLADSFFPDILKIKELKSILKASYKSFDEEYFVKKCEEYEIPMDKKISELSGGMKAKLRVITALSHDSKILILDEPTSGLDVVSREEILTELRDYMEKDEERSIVISSHISSDIEKICDDIYVINNGEIVIHDDTDTLLFEYAALKLSEEDYESLDKQYVIAVRKESYGYECLTDKKDYYLENCPEMVIEKMNLDELMLILYKGEKL
jgi:ABC-2 type transport system ATP-binding protein